MPTDTTASNAPAKSDEMSRLLARNFDSAANPGRDASYARAYRGLEPQVADMHRMAAIARFYVNETEWPSEITKEQSIEIERVIFLIGHIADMAKDLEQAYYKVYSEAAAGKVAA
jgi:hypothetical protein